MSVFNYIEKVSDKKSFLVFMKKLVEDYKEHTLEWENTSIAEYLEAMISWIEDYSSSEFNDIDWDNVDYVTMAKILYMGKIYE